MQVENRQDNQNPCCPVCALPSRYDSEAPGWGVWRVCDRCGLEFADPLRLPESPQTLFNGAYRGQRQESAFYDFNRNLQRRGALIEDPALGFWTRAYADVLEWLARRVGRGSKVLELGCGPGFFLHAMRQWGFDPVGLDIAKEVVDLNRRDGFQVWHGGVETVPPGWVQPDAVVSFFMLHHLEDPMGYLAAIRRQWPDAPLAIAQYGPGRRSPLRSSPPRNLTRWNSGALRVALEDSGYVPAVVDLRSSGVESDFLNPVRKILKPTVAFPWLFRLNKRIERRVLPRVLQPLRKDDEVILAFAEPSGVPIDRTARPQGLQPARSDNSGGRDLES